MVIGEPQFFDTIRVSNEARCEEIRGKVGYILGVSEEDGLIYGYSAWIYDFERVSSVGIQGFELLGYKDERAKADYGKHEFLRVDSDGKVK